MKVPVHAISMATLLTALLGLPASADENTDAFMKLDVDHDGYITVHESLANSQLNDVFEEADLNGDGMLDMAEFTKLEITDE